MVDITPSMARKMLKEGTPLPKHTPRERVNRPAIEETKRAIARRREEAAAELPIKDDYEGATTEELLQLMGYVLGEASTKRIAVLAKGRSTTPIAVLRVALQQALETGEFDALGAKEPRTGNDENWDNRDTRRVLALVGGGNMNKLMNAARERKVSNLSALRAGVAWLIGRGEI